MKNLNYRFFFVLLILGLVLLVGCSGSGEATEEASEGEASAEPSAEDVAEVEPPPTDDLIFDPTNSVLWSYGTQNVTANSANNGTANLPGVIFAAVDPNENMQINWANGAAATDISEFTVNLTGGAMTVTRGAATYSFSVNGTAATQEPTTQGLSWPQDLTTLSGTTLSYKDMAGTTFTVNNSDVDQITVPFADTAN